MKKSFVLVMCAVATMAFLGTSCKKKTENTGSNFTYNLQTLEQDNFDGDRTYIDWRDNLTKWVQGDHVRVYNVNLADAEQTVSDMFTATAATGATITPLNGGSVGPMQDCYMAFYPGEGALDQIEEGNREHFRLEAEQVALPYIKDGTANLAYGAVAMASRIESGTHFPFSNICGVAAIKLKFDNDMGLQEPLIVESVTITDNQMHLTGEVSFYMTELATEDVLTLTNDMRNQVAGWEQELLDYKDQIGYQSVPEEYSITLNLEQITKMESLTLDATNPKAFYFGIRPFALAYGFTVDVTFTNGMTAHITKWEAENFNYIMQPNKIKSFTCFVDDYLNVN